MQPMMQSLHSTVARTTNSLATITFLLGLLGISVGPSSSFSVLLAGIALIITGVVLQAASQRYFV